MEILPMLARLENALGCPDLTKKMVLVPKAQTAPSKSLDSINLVVGYNASPQSQTALDLTLWIAHQTRLATRRSVTVQVVYVIDLSAMGQPNPSEARLTEFNPHPAKVHPTMAGMMATSTIAQSGTELALQLDPHGTATAIAELPEPTLPVPHSVTKSQLQQFEQADHILWQARNLANEWRGSLKTHLRFGSVAEELSKVAIAEAATVILLGCTSTDDPLVQQLKAETPCPILGIPTAE